MLLVDCAAPLVLIIPMLNGFKNLSSFKGGKMSVACCYLQVSVMSNDRTTAAVSVPLTSHVDDGSDAVGRHMPCR